MDTYKGDSPAKKMVRGQFWSFALHRVGHRVSKVAFLIGRECGDVRTLHGMGLPFRKMVGIERDERAYEEALNKAPFVDVRLGDIEQQLCVPEFRRAFDVVLIDTCSPLDTQIIRKAARVAAYTIRHEGILGMGFMFGREKSGRVLKEIEEVKKFARDFPIRGKGFLFQDPNGKEQWIDGKEFDENDPAFIRMMRLYTVDRLVYNESSRLGVGVNSIWSSSYQSSTRTGRGVPMNYTAFRVWRPKHAKPRLMLEEFEKRAFTEPFVPYVLPNDPGRWESEIREGAIEFASRPGQNAASAADVFNVDPNTVRAWLAHYTRTRK